jgi:hypothetical protein
VLRPPPIIALGRPVGLPQSLIPCNGKLVIRGPRITVQTVLSYDAGLSIGILSSQVFAELDEKLKPS